MSSSSAAASAFSLDHIPPPPSEQLCYVHCTICDTVLAVSVPCTSLFKTVTVRCGHCSNLLPINMRALLLPSSVNQTPHHHHFSHHPFFSPSHNFLEEIANPTANFLRNQTAPGDLSLLARAGCTELPRPPVMSRPPEKKQRVPSAYNRFIKEEIQRIKAVNPDISHREAFSAAAKNWAHFPHIQFGLGPDQSALKKTNNVCQQDNGEGGGVLKDGYFGSANNNNNNNAVGISPYSTLS